MDEESKLYMSQMNSWIKEQNVLEEQIKRTISHHEMMSENHRSVAALNVLQLDAHVKRTKISKEEFENWKQDNNIEGDVE